jgi:hypothetical protein
MMIGTQLMPMRASARRRQDHEFPRETMRLTLVDGAAGDRVLVARHTTDSGDAGAALADRDVQAGDVEAEERLEEPRDDRVARVLDGLAALGPGGRGSAGAASRSGSREGGEAGEGEGEDLGVHGDGGSAELGAGKCGWLSWRGQVEQECFYT